MAYRSITLALSLVLVTLATAGEKSPIPDPGFAVTAKSVVVIEEKSGKVLWSRDADAKRFPASTTKIMTALLLLEKCKRDELITAPKDAETVEGSSLHLKAGETISAWDMAHALLIRSANDGSYSTAIHISGTIDQFAELMNAKAKEIGCTGTHFHNPNGLPDPEHYTTAHDLALIAREAMKDPGFREVAKTRKYQVTRSLNQEDTWLISKNKYLAWDPTTDGIKTGYTVQAGHCFVGSATRNGFRVITVVLASQDWKADYKALTNWAFAANTRTQVAQAGDIVGKASVSGGDVSTVGLALKEPVYYAMKKGGKLDMQVAIEPSKEIAAPVEKGAPAGFAVYSDAAGWRLRAPLVAAVSVGRGSLIAKATGGHWSFYFVAGMLGVSAYMVRRKSRRMAYAARRR